MYTSVYYLLNLYLLYTTNSLDMCSLRGASLLGEGADLALVAHR